MMSRWRMLIHDLLDPVGGALRLHDAVADRYSSDEVARHKEARQPTFHGSDAVDDGQMPKPVLGDRPVPSDDATIDGVRGNAEDRAQISDDGVEELIVRQAGEQRLSGAPDECGEGDVPFGCATRKQR